MANRRLTALRATLMTAIGVSLMWSCGGESDDGSPGTGGAASPLGGKPGTAGGGAAGATFGGASGGRNPTAGTAGWNAGAGGSDAGSGGSWSTPACRNPRPLANGYVQCTGDWLHRPSKAACPIRIDSGQGGEGGGGHDGGGNSGAGGFGEGCTTDADCTARPYGHCEETRAAFGAACYYGCSVDEDCGAGEICVCGPKAGVCSQADCVTDADCGDGVCAGNSLAHVGGAVCDAVVAAPYRFACQTSEDECTGNDDCGSDQEQCAFTVNARRCEGESVCGRPFLVDGRPRQAASRVDSGWALHQSPNRDGLSHALRQQLADHYTRLGLMEHASIAAFARFTLELLSLGAPADLLRATQQALADETTHAELCFGLVSAYADSAIGPDTLPLDGALESGRDWLAIVRCAFLEACIGETIAVAEAGAALEASRDPAVRATLVRIAADEARHAELGWRFVSWMLERAGADRRAEALTALRALLEHELSMAPYETPSGVDEEDWDRDLLAHGVLPRAARAAARRAALTEVVVPCASALGITARGRREQPPALGELAENSVRHVTAA